MDGSKLCDNLVGDRDPDSPEGEAAATCIPGCYLPGDQCADKLAADPNHRGKYIASCSYPPTQLKDALEAHEWGQTNENRHVWNELVVDLRSVTSRLPASVEGFFCPVGAGQGERAKLSRTRDAFLADYGLPSDAAEVVLVQLDFGAAQAFSPLL